MSAACAPEPTATRAASAATTVFPDPTSPSRSRDIGTVRARSWRISPSERERQLADPALDLAVLDPQRERLRILRPPRAALAERELQDEELVERETAARREERGPIGREVHLPDRRLERQQAASLADRLRQRLRDLVNDGRAFRPTLDGRVQP